MEKVKKERERETHEKKRGTYTEKKNYIYIYPKMKKRGTTREWGKGCIQ